ncbi:MAG: cysteine peptidase family C39 domain-containing protein [Planctomycetota bacterium]
MRARSLVSAVAALSLLSCTAFADRQLERSEILKIFETLTSQPRRTWISAGTIEATHEEYRAAKRTDTNHTNEGIQKRQGNAKLSNEYTMNSNVVVRYDGDRFYWEINANSRTDSVKPNADLGSNQFDPARNARRIFVWDGQKYTIYSRSGHRAIVDATGSLPHVVNGPLTAGLIRWGYGHYTYKNLSAAGSSATEKHIDGQTQIHLTLNRTDGSEISFVLDAERNLAVISHRVEGPDKTTFKQYDNYRVVSGKLVPTTIVIEQHDAGTNRLLASDFWHFKSISVNTPPIGDFSIEYDTDDVIEYKSPITKKAAVYRYSPMIDAEILLAERLAFAASEGMQEQNCATAALKYAASQFGKDIADSQLAQLVKGPNGATNLRGMKEFAQRQGLHCRAVKTDIETLKGLSDCEVILHFPKKNHFVTLGDIDSAYVWSIDLASRRFCYRTDVGLFGMDWSEGTALLVSDRPITVKLNDIDDGRLPTIIGAAGYTCTELLQEDDYFSCDSSGGGCQDAYEYWPERWGCEEAPSGMCWDSWMLWLAECSCIQDPDDFDCDVDGDWSFYYMIACY